MYLINTDSSIEGCNPGGIISIAFIVKIMGKGEVYREARIARHADPTNTNNQGEYLAVVAAMMWLLQLPEEQKQSVIIQSDSKLVVNQCSHVWDCKDPQLSKLCKLVTAGVIQFGKSVTFKWIPRDRNADADELSRTAYDDADIQREMKELREERFKQTFGNDDIPW